jgi:hypothetical protein
MTRRAKSRSAFIFICLIAFCLSCVSKCRAQYDQRRFYDGVVTYTETFIYILDRNDSIHYILEILQVDTLKRNIVYKVISADGIGFVRSNENDLSYHYKTTDGIKPRAKLKRYYFLK